MLYQTSATFVHDMELNFMTKTDVVKLTNHMTPNLTS